MPHRAPVGGTRSRRVAIDARISGIARRQRGLITRQQLLGDVALGRGAVDHRLATGQLVAVHPGVYRVPGPAVQLSWALAAALATGAVVSGRSAAAVHGIGSRGPRVEVTAARQHRRPTIDCHLARLSADDVTVHLDVPVTTVARTVYDIAGRPECARLGELVNRARLVRPGLLAELDLLVARIHGRGHPRLAAERLQPHLSDQNGPVRSVFEQRFRQAITQSDLPSPLFNVRVGGLEVDVLWPQAALVVELDGYAYHSDAAAFERDRERDAQLGALDHQVIRITWQRWRDRPDVELRRLRAIIRGRAGRAISVDFCLENHGKDLLRGQ